MAAKAPKLAIKVELPTTWLMKDAVALLPEVISKVEELKDVKVMHAGVTR